MPKTITDSTGEELEVFTPDEVEQQRQEALDAFKAENPDQSDALQELQDKLTQQEEELEKLRDKDTNFNNLRTEKKKAEDRISALQKEIDEKIETVSQKTRQEVMEEVNRDHYNETLKGLADGDQDLQKKIEFHFARIQDDATTKESITKRLTDAYLLATGSPAQDSPAPSDAFASGGAGMATVREQGNKLNDEEKAFLKKLGQAGGLQFKDEDLK